MVKTVRVFLALFATLWYTTSPINSNAPSQIWEYDINRMETYPKWSKKKKIMASIDRHIFYGSKKTL
jgi:hypothetical protein